MKCTSTCEGAVIWFQWFESARITEAVEKSNEVFERIENPFLASRNDKN